MNNKGTKEETYEEPKEGMYYKTTENLKKGNHKCFNCGKKIAGGQHCSYIFVSLPYGELDEAGDMYTERETFEFCEECMYSWIAGQIDINFASILWG